MMLVPPPLVRFCLPASTHPSCHRPLSFVFCARAAVPDLLETFIPHIVVLLTDKTHHVLLTGVR